MAINRIKTGGITDGTIQSGDIAPGTIASDRIAPGTIASDRIAPGTITNDRLAGSIANDKLANSSITINGTSIALGASGEIVAGTDWQAVTVADGSTLVNAVAGEGYLLDTNTGVIEVVFPGSPTRGDTIKIVDYGGNFATNNCLVNLNGSFLDSTSLGYFNLSTNDTLAEFVYIDSNKGWLFYQNSTQASTPSTALVSGQLGINAGFTSATGGTITTSGDYKIHTFTGDGCFVVTAGNAPLFPGNPQAGPAAVDYMVVGGGGAGGDGIGGGGGGGGFRASAGTETGCYTAGPLASGVSAITITSGTHPITVGAGGAVTNTPGCQPGRKGSDSIFSTITSAGGGGGGSPNSDPYRNGGSGGGSSHRGGTGGTGNTPPVSPPQGSNAGASPNPSGFGGSGGGGATGTGAAPTNPQDGFGGQAKGGNGGAGITSCITGSPSGYSGGGGGGGYQGPGGSLTGDSSGGSGGGGNGGSGGNTSNPGQAGGANQGGGGGGKGQTYPGTGTGNGGKGIVVLRYKFQ